MTKITAGIKLEAMKPSPKLAPPAVRLLQRLLADPRSLDRMVENSRQLVDRVLAKYARPRKFAARKTA